MIRNFLLNIDFLVTTSTDRYFYGKIDELLFYNYELNNN